MGACSPIFAFNAVNLWHLFNNILDNANLLPPKDPEGADVMVADLILTKDRIVEILERALDVVSDWLIEQKEIYNSKARTEGK